MRAAGVKPNQWVCKLQNQGGLQLRGAMRALMLRLTGYFHWKMMDLPA
jgi:hypothetical protein